MSAFSLQPSAFSLHSSAIERLREELATLFDSVGGDRIELSLGVLVRVQREDGEGWDYRIEV